MPSREELLSKLLGTMQAPIAQFVRTLNEVPTKFARGLAAVRDQKPRLNRPSFPEFAERPSDTQTLALPNIWSSENGT